jgi:hypothetical protein
MHCLCVKYLLSVQIVSKCLSGLADICGYNFCRFRHGDDEVGGTCGTNGREEEHV